MTTLIGIATWVVLSGPVALALGQLLRQRSEALLDGSHEAIEHPELIGSGRAH